jgi:hypothetical protein
VRRRALQKVSSGFERNFYSQKILSRGGQTEVGTLTRRGSCVLHVHNLQLKISLKASL